MKILHVITAFDRGGAENHLVDLVKHQRSAGWNVTIAYLRGNGYWVEPMRKLGVTLHFLALRFYGDPRPMFRLRDLVRRSRPDLVHAHLPPAELYARLALLGLDAELPVVITKHNEERFAPGPLQKWLGCWVGRRARKVIAISAAVQRYMTGPALGLDARKFHTIYYGLDTAPYAEVRDEDAAALRKEWGVAEGGLAIGFVGRLVEQKDIGTLLRGFALIADRFPAARLVIVGGGSCQDSLQRCAEELGIAERVVWTGFRDDIPTVMRAFDIFALTSIYEGLGLVLLEAMAAGVAVAATRVGAIPEVVVEGETGLLTGPGQPEELAAALQKLSDRTVRTRMGEAGRQRVLREFTLGRMFRETDRLYQQCLRPADAEPETLQEAVR